MAENKERFTLWQNCIKIFYHFTSRAHQVLNMQSLVAVFATDLELITPNQSSLLSDSWPKVKWVSLDRLPGQTTTIICFSYHRVTVAGSQVQWP